ncbi:hypothetical protein EVAR_81144_1 [Eumeta japonica]|uniref:Uncharacterized protein n=1 Tax=Eumeta variegata TaxID=151549 RepID=A0A4C1UKD6_EUMVA|nr:hypothetical protein EVAR_81144_1 [Eumeta japonica]
MYFYYLTTPLVDGEDLKETHNSRKAKTYLHHMEPLQTMRSQLVTLGTNCKIWMYVKHVLWLFLVGRDAGSELRAADRSVEWERDGRFGGPLSSGDSSLRYERYTFQSDSQPQPNLRRCHVKRNR